jgi:hypothetical protein
MFQTKFVEKIKTRLIFSNFFPENCALYEIMCKNMVQPDWSHYSIIRRMRFVCWITKATHTHTICSTYCFFLVTVVTLTRHNVNVIRTLPVLLLEKPWVGVLLRRL